MSRNIRFMLLQITLIVLILGSATISFVALVGDEEHVTTRRVLDVPLKL